MAKFTLAIKKPFIDLMETNKSFISTAVKELVVLSSVAKRWWKMYRIHGEGFTKKLGRYNGEFKVHVVKYMHKNYLPITKASVIFRYLVMQHF